MSEKPNYRQERIERLLHELKYEITRGMMEGEIDEHLGFNFYVPVSRNLHEGVVRCQFRTAPVHRMYALGDRDADALEPMLKIVKG